MSTSDTGHRGMITLCVMVATIMQALDMTIANVALPHMQGSMSATQDQISWVLTSYIVASAIMMPLAGFLTGRFGRKRVFMVAVAGFTIASVLCGAAQSLAQIVAFRLLQGAFGAALVPLSQAVLLDTWPRPQHGQAMALWGIGVMVGPILGPTLGGWLTEYYSWRWVFYINVPFGVLTWFGLAAFVHETEIDRRRRFDVLGFAFLAVAIGTFQMMLDRGESLDWFAAREIWIESVVAAVGFYAFIVHIFTVDHPFLEPALFADRNFAVGLLFIFVVGVILLATMALLPPFMQNLLGYPVLRVGYLLAPRGMGTMVAMVLVGRLSGRVDVRLMIFAGLALTAYSLHEMAQFNLDVTAADFVRTGIVQGFGLGLVFVPLSTITFATLAPHYRTEGTALFSLLRSIGSSIGISVVVTLLSRNLQANHAAFGAALTPWSIALTTLASATGLDPHTAYGAAMLNAEVTRQAATLAYLQDFRVMMWLTLAALPFVVLFRRPPRIASGSAGSPPPVD